MQYPNKTKPVLGYNIPDVIVQVIKVDSLGRTPAMCLRKLGIVFISNEFEKLPKDYQQFILAHESGHIYNNSRDEFLADDYAVNWCVSNGMSLTNCLFAMTKVLSFPNDRPRQKEEQIMRCKRQFRRLIDYDANVNKNPKAMEINKTVSEELDSFAGKKLKRAFQKPKKAISKVIHSKPLAKPITKLVQAKPVNKIIHSRPVVSFINSKPVNKLLASPLGKLAPNPLRTALTAIKKETTVVAPATVLSAPVQKELDEYYKKGAGAQADTSVGGAGGGGFYNEDEEEEEMPGGEIVEVTNEDNEDEEAYVDETISDEVDSFGGLFKSFRENRRIKTEAKAQAIRDKGEAKKMKAEAKLELAKQGIVDKGLAGLGAGLGAMNANNSAAPSDEDTSKIMGMKKPLFYGVVAGVLVLAVVVVFLLKNKKAVAHVG